MDSDRIVPPGDVDFGNVAGRAARLYMIESDQLRARITDYGGILVSLEAPAPGGGREHVVLGFEDAADYASHGGSFGALLGRSANRIAGGTVMIDGHTYALSKNENGSTLHGGAVGFGKQFWSIVSATHDSVALRLISRDGDQGFPGEVEVIATYRLSDAALHLAFDARTTKPTPLSLSAHPYFNLDGVGARDILDHRVEIFATHFLPTDEKQIPTGEQRPVSGSVFDFSAPLPVGARIRAADVQLRYARGYDHYYILPQESVGRLRPAMRAYGSKTGRALEILTTQRGMQFYTGNNLNGSAPGRGGLYRQSAGFAAEPQGFPNAPNQPGFPTTVLLPGAAYHEEIVYRFLSADQKALP